LGAVVVVIGLILIFSFLKASNTMTQQTESSATKLEESNIRPSTYVVKKGDDLWNIAKNLYGSGYNWVDLANANKLGNPSVLYVGTKLTVPNAKPILVEQPKQVVQKPVAGTSVAGSSYTVVKGDFLWNIAIRAYGDGYRWVDIARANKLVNPNIIHSGNVLILPR
jgi:nucleoid-associated protein YgaU